jgi:hypothetical protein
MSLNPTTPWHKASYDQFLYDSLPQLLAERLPLADYQVTEAGPHACSLCITLSGGIQAVFASLPRPDEGGLFYLADEPCVVIPTASQEALDIAEIACVGEQLLAFIQERLGQASNDITWNEEALRAWLPLDRWIDEFLHAKAQRLDTTNWLSHHTHLRRMIIPNRQKVIAAGQFGRVCPYETPESANIGKVFTVAVGAEIRDGKIIIVDARPEASLGLSASMLPFLEHNDPNRLLMAANMQRQNLPHPSPEPALVQTGLEPAGARDFWCGYNLLTALVSLGEATTEDGIVISQSAAQRMQLPTPVEPGDKFCNRHGIKGVISQILPDEAMPHLPDGTPIELAYSFSGVPNRLVFGPALEAAWGRVAHAEGQAVIAPPFGAPPADELRLRLKAAGLPEDGQEFLTLGKGGQTCEQQTTVGWMYWSRMVPRTEQRLTVSTQASMGLGFGELEFQALKTAGATENIREAFVTRSARRPGADRLAEELASGPVISPSGPTPWFTELSHRLQVAGIQVELQNGKLACSFTQPPGNTLKLAKPMPHPWLHERTIETVGVWEGGGSEGGASEGNCYTALAEANERLARMLASHTPTRLVQSASDSLSERLEAYFKNLLPAEAMSLGSQIFWSNESGFGEPQLFSAKAMAAPGIGLRLDQVGLPDEIAWTLFAPLVNRKLGTMTMPPERTPAAARALDEVMAASWVIVQRSTGEATPTGLLAFHPVRNPEQAGHPDRTGLPDRVIRLHPLACGPLNADFDGDQLAVYLPVTAAAQQEASEKMTLAAHLKRDPSLVKTMLYVDLLWGLAWVYLKPDGREAIAELLNADPGSLPDLLTQDALHRLTSELLQRAGADVGLDRMQSLAHLGYQSARNSGASFSPFFASRLHLPPMPESDNPDRWWAYREEAAEAILAGTDYHDPTFGPQLLSAKTRERSRLRIPWLTGPRGLVMDAADQLCVVRHTQMEGWTPKEAFACVAGARRAFAEMFLKNEITPPTPGGWNVLSRARRAKYPGIVFARAAASGEVDPLEDLDSQLRVGEM